MIPRLDIIDDDPGIVALLKDIAETIGFEIHTYLDGIQFQKEYDPNQNGIILLDLIMPECNGIEVMNHLSQHHCDKPIILISGYDISILNSAQLLASKQHLNIVKKFSKPLPIAELQDCLRHLYKTCTENETISQ